MEFAVDEVEVLGPAPLEFKADEVEVVSEAPSAKSLFNDPWAASGKGEYYDSMFADAMERKGERDYLNYRLEDPRLERRLRNVGFKWLGQGLEGAPTYQEMQEAEKKKPLWAKSAPQEMPQGQGNLDYVGIARQYAEEGVIPPPAITRQIPPQHRTHFAQLFAKYAEELGPNKDKWKVEKFARGATDSIYGVAGNIVDTAELAGAPDTAVALGRAYTGKPGTNDLSPEEKSYYEEIKNIALTKDPLTGNENFFWKSAMQANEMLWPMLAGQAVGTALGSGRIAQTIGNSAFWSSQTFPDEYDKMVTKGADPKTAKVAAAWSSLLQSGVESLNISLQPFGGVSGVRQRAWEAAKTFFKEAVVEEGSQAALSKLFEDVAVEGKVDLAAAITEALRAPVAAAGPMVFLLGPGAAMSLRKGMLEDKAAVQQFVAQNPAEAKKIAEKDGAPSRKDINLLEEVGILAPDQFRKQADRQQLKDAVVEAQQAAEVPTDVPPESIAAPEQQAPPQQFPENQQFPTQETPAIQETVQPEQPTVEEQPQPAQPAQEVPPPPPQADGVDYNQVIDYPEYTSVRNAMMERDRKWLNANYTLPSKEKITQTMNIAKVRELGMVEMADSVAEKIANEGVPPEGVNTLQQVAFRLRAAELKNEYLAIRDEFDPTADDSTNADRAARIKDIHQKFENLEVATNMYGSEFGRGLQDRKNAIDNKYEPVEMAIRARAAKGSPLTVEERNELNDMSKKISELEAKIKEFENNAPAAIADKVVKKTRESRSRKKRKEMQAALPSSFEKARELFNAGCLGF